MILVTGSTGYIGSQITHFLESNNIRYIGIDNFLHSSNFNINNKKKFFKIDIKDSGKIKKVVKKFNIKTVIHCAASSYVVKSVAKLFEKLFENVENVLDVKCQVCELAVIEGKDVLERLGTKYLVCKRISHLEHPPPPGAT